MQPALRVIRTVQPGGRVEITSSELPTGKAVEVIVLFPEQSEDGRRSVTEILAEAPGHLAFQTAEDVEAHIRRERDAWDR